MNQKTKQLLEQCADAMESIASSADMGYLTQRIRTTLSEQDNGADIMEMPWPVLQDPSEKLCPEQDKAFQTFMQKMDSNPASRDHWYSL